MRSTIVILWLSSLACAQADLSAVRAAAEHGDAKAQNELGIAYQWGSAPEGKDYDQAAKWFQAAAKQNYGPAQFNLGVMYLDGEHFTADDPHALAWFTLALGNGEEAARDAIRRLQNNTGDVAQNEAFVLLGNMLVAGEEVPANVPRALYFLDLAAQHKDGAAEYTLCRLYIEGKKVTPDLGIGRRYCESAMQHRMPVAGAFLGITLVEGRLVAADKESGRAVLLQSAQGGAPLAFYALGKFEQQGSFGVPDSLEAYKWFAIGEYLGCKQCADERTALSALLTPDQVKQAMKKATDWNSKHGPLVLRARPNPFLKK